MSRSKGLAYASSPLLASRTPVWRSKFIVAGIALAFVVLAGRAAWVQVFANDFYRRQGEVRFARTLELAANRGRIFDRNGLLLATSVPVPSVWAIPEDVERDKMKLAQLAKLLQIPLADLMARMGHASTRAALIYIHTNSKRDHDVAARIDRLLPPASGT